MPLSPKELVRMASLHAEGQGEDVDPPRMTTCDGTVRDKQTTLQARTEFLSYAGKARSSDTMGEMDGKFKRRKLKEVQIFLSS